MAMDASTISITAEYDEKQLEWLRSKKVCEECQSIFDHWCARNYWPSERPDHRHHTLGGLQESARKGCPVCEIFLDSFFGESLSKTRIKDYLERALVRVEADKIIQGFFEISLVYTDVPGSSRLNSRIILVLADQDHNKTVGAVNEYTDCPESWKLVRKWLKLCGESHSRCGEAVMDRKLPTRLVDVGTDNSQVRLCLARDLPEVTRYLTLSHCWGRKAFKTLTYENMETFCSGIPESALSKTFRDAMDATRELGFSYIWIDSLCILQDDRSDWDQEAALMGNIYANSTLNLAAIDAPDGDGGCFFRRENRSLSCWKLSLIEEKDSQTPRMWNCYPDNFLTKIGTGNILSKRAWAFQERCLAPRSLSFGKKELLWECREMAASETIPNGFKYDIMTIPEILSKWCSPRTKYNPYSWFSVVTSYSIGELTFESDKLVALSGLARLFEKIFNTHYLAGIWREDLVRQLTWYAFANFGPAAQSYRAPSWSWASTNSQVNLQRRARRGTRIDLVAVEQAYVISPGCPFDEVSGGELSLRCQAFGRGRVFLNEAGQFGVMCSEDSLFWSRVYPDHKPHNFHGELFYLPIVLSDELNTSENWELWGLVLRCEILEKYVRVGCFCVYRSQDIEHFYSELLGKPVAMEEICQNPGFRDNEKNVETGRLITIV